MQKNNRKPNKWESWYLLGAGLILFTLFCALSSPSEASGSDKKITEGYEGSDRIIAVEKPVKGKTNTTRKQGWIGDKRIDLKIVQTPKHTETKGWVGDNYINVKERKDD